MRQTSSSRWLLLPLCLAAGLTTVSSSHSALAQQASAGDIAQARELLNQGLDLRNRGDASGALEKLKAAHALAHTPITGLELGRTYAATGRLVEARETFLSVARIPERPEETGRSKAARSESEQLGERLRSRIPTLTITITGVSAESVTVMIDGAVVPTEALSAPRFVNPGDHDVSARSTTGATAETRVDLNEGESRHVALSLTTAKEPAPVANAIPPQSASILSTPAPLDRPTGHARSVLGLVLGGVGIVGMGVSGVLGLVAKNEDNSAAREPFPAKHDDSVAAAHLAVVATAVLGAGAAVTVVGAIVWLTAPKAPIALGASAHGAILSGRF